MIWQQSVCIRIIWFFSFGECGFSHGFLVMSIFSGEIEHRKPFSDYSMVYMYIYVKMGDESTMMMNVTATSCIFLGLQVQ